MLLPAAMQSIWLFYMEMPAPVNTTIFFASRMGTSFSVWKSSRPLPAYREDAAEEQRQEEDNA